MKEEGVFESGFSIFKVLFFIILLPIFPIYLIMKVITKQKTDLEIQIENETKERKN